MTGTANSTSEKTSDRLRTIDLDLSLLMGNEILIFSRQFPGKTLKSRVIMIADQTFSVDRSGSGGLIDNLVSNQKVTVQFEYRNQMISVNALLKRTMGGRCTIALEDRIVPLANRRFRRVNMNRTAKLAIIPSISLSQKGMPNLRWIEATTDDVSAGGLKVTLTTSLECEVNVLLSLDMSEFPIPPLILGEVRYCIQSDIGQYSTGVEFVVKERRDNRRSSSIVKILPPVVFSFTERIRSTLDTTLYNWQKVNKESQIIGEKHG